MKSYLPEDAKLYFSKDELRDLSESDLFRLYSLRKATNKLSDEEKEKALLIRDYLMNPRLLEIIDSELDKKIVRENESRKVIFLVANMRNVENLSKGSDNLIVNALSGTGKDHVVGAVFDLIPEIEKEELIRTTPKVLAYTRNRAISNGGKRDE